MNVSGNLAWYVEQRDITLVAEDLPIPFPLPEKDDHAPRKFWENGNGLPDGAIGKPPAFNNSARLLHIPAALSTFSIEITSLTSIRVRSSSLMGGSSTGIMTPLASKLKDRPDVTAENIQHNIQTPRYDLR